MRVGRYETLRRIACGTLSELWLARLVGIEGFAKVVVLKWMRSDIDDAEQATRMFVREARIAARLDHPNIVHTLDLGLSHGRHFVAMEYVHGETLARLLARGGALPEACAVRIAVEVLGALAYAHARDDDDGSPLGIVHRDVSPQNVIVGHDGNVVLVDFGIARATAWEDLTYTGEVKGTLAFAAPEQARGDDVDARVDVYATGALLFDLLTGRPPGGGQGDVALLSRLAAGIVDVDLGALPGGLAAIVRTAMDTDRNLRFPTAAAMRAALIAEAGARGLDLGAEPLRRLLAARCGTRPHPSGAPESWFGALPAATPSRVAPTRAHRPVLGYAVAGLLGASAVAAGVAITGDESRESPRPHVDAILPAATAPPAPSQPPVASPMPTAAPPTAAPAIVAAPVDDAPARKPTSRRAPRAKRSAAPRDLDALLPPERE